MTIGKRISELRKKKGFTQEYIAEQLGVSRQAVSKWEQDQSTPDTKNLIALADLLNSSVEYIATGKTTEGQNHQHRTVKALYEISAFLLIAAAVVHLVGLVTGAYSRMVSIGGLGIPFLWYGTSTNALVLMVISGIFAILAIILFIVGYRIKVYQEK